MASLKTRTGKRGAPSEELTPQEPGLAPGLDPHTHFAVEISPWKAFTPSLGDHSKEG